MLRQSFVFLPGIRKQREKRLWQQGIADWNSFLSSSTVRGISAGKKDICDAVIVEARERLLADDSSFFASMLPSAEHWRLYDAFKEEACFLDVETGCAGEITVVSLVLGDQCHTFLRNSTLTGQNLLRVLSKAKLIVSFNGRSFDVPVIERYFGIKISLPHIDLFHLCRSLGLKGGLKDIERHFGIVRPAALSVLRGPQAPELWRCWRATGNEHFLNLLVQYNQEDAINLKPLADKLVGMMKTRILATWSYH